LLAQVSQVNKTVFDVRNVENDKVVRINVNQLNLNYNRPAFVDKVKLALPEQKRNRPGQDLCQNAIAI